MSTGRHGPNVGRVKSCTGCRQVKLACDARKTLPEACSRCQKKGMECRFDTNFKRVPTRKLVAELHNELQLLRTSDANRPRNTFPEIQILNASYPSSSSSSAPAFQHSPLGTIEHLTPPEGPRKWLNIEEGDVSRIYQLGAVVLQPQIVLELFHHFEVYYIAYAGFLQPFSSLASHLEKSALLFWTIVLIACQHHDRYSPFYPQLALDLDTLLAPVVQIAIQDIETIHALLLLALWPVAKSRQAHDPSGNYIALSTNAAMQLNCHNPLNPGSEIFQWKGFSNKAGSDLSMEAQSLTWLACFVMGTSTSLFQGFPPPLSSLQQLKTIDRAFNLLAAVSMTTLDGIEGRNMHFSLTQNFDRQLDDLKSAHSGLWTSQLEIDFCSAKLCMYGLTFVLPGPSDLETRVHRDTILHKALEAACSLVAEVKKVNDTPAAPEFYPCGMLTFVPKLFFVSLFNATTFLFRFLATDITRTPQHESLAMGSIIEAHKIFQSFTGQRDITRAAIHTEVLVNILREKVRDGPPLDDLIVTNRLGASVMLDAVFRAGRQRNRNPSTGEVVPLREWKTLNDTFAERLPIAPHQRTKSMSTPNDSHNELSWDDPAWWQEWDQYMDDFQVGMEQWPETDQSPDPQMFGMETNKT